MPLEHFGISIEDEMDSVMHLISAFMISHCDVKDEVDGRTSWSYSAIFLREEITINPREHSSFTKIGGTKRAVVCIWIMAGRA